MPKDAANVLIVSIDDADFGVPDTFGGFAHTPTLSKLARQGISVNRFHTTSICSPTRAALLTGRNHQRVGGGTIAECAVDWDGYNPFAPLRCTTSIKSNSKGNRIAREATGVFFGLWTRDGKTPHLRTGYVSRSRADHNRRVETRNFPTWVMDRETFL